MTGDTLRHCTVRYGQNSILIPLPLLPPPDSYDFLKLHLCNKFPELEHADIQVSAVGASQPGFWPRNTPLQRQTYRIHFQPGPAGTTGDSGKPPNLLVVSVNKLQCKGYFPADISIPSVLELCVAQELLAGSQRMIRRRPYTADSHVLEFAFYKHFEDMHSARGMTFGLNQQSGLGVDSYKAKLQFIRAMSDRKLMLRIKDFAMGKELLLLPKDSMVHGYITDTGTIEEIATQEMQAILTDHKLVLVLDLDQTLLHTAETPEDKAELLQGLPPSELQSQLLDLAQHGATMQQRLADMLSAPRASLLNFFKRIRNRYQVFYLTAGVQSYGEAAVSAIQAFLLSDTSIDDADRRWIRWAVNPRNVMSSAFANGQREYPQLGIPAPGRHARSFKSLGMLFKMAVIPDYTARLVLIVDYTLGVWLRKSDRQLVHPIQKQQYLTSHTKSIQEHELMKFATLAAALWDKAYGTAGNLNRGKTLRELESAVAMEHWANYLYTSQGSQN